MTSTTKALIAAGLAVVFAVGFIVWQVKARRSESLNLSAEDMALIAEDQPPQFRSRLPQMRRREKVLPKTSKSCWPLPKKRAPKASQQAGSQTPARSGSLGCGCGKLFQIAGQAGANGPNISEQEVEEFFKQPANQTKFDQFINDAKAKNPQLAGGPDSGRTTQTG